MNFPRFHRKVTPSFFSGSSSEPSRSQTSLHAVETRSSSSTNSRTTFSCTSSPAESAGDKSPSLTVRLIPRLFDDRVLISVDRPILSVVLSWTPSY